ncbi:hypothetical protein RUMHYD_03768 [Blautia hydrogenotrophica DSM 10507]|uniref:Uncharacterized protein n=1 Tax=Blautia hydrogenotrophica (strain DSM 10507 / JCM 14656 / S5a33) TaxID=476272 RepID=C0CS78_BLAHS|nr:hypothetical protein RUMHYD_03768 [Blautia hydrogenotrophica DSM 10507]
MKFSIIYSFFGIHVHWQFSLRLPLLVFSAILERRSKMKIMRGGML